MKKKSLLLLGCLFLGISMTNAQVGIGTENPDKSAMLDVVAGDKGILLPRVNLTSITMDLDGNGATAQPAGLMVFNTGTVLPSGYYFWNGTEWRNLVDGSGIAGAIGDLRCLEATLEPQMFSENVFYRGTLKVPYDKGNGGKYNTGEWISSTNNTGLKARLKSGVLEYGSGYLIYDVEGTPSADSPTPAVFAVSFPNTSGSAHSCSVSVGTEIEAEVKMKATVGPLSYTTDNGAVGYGRTLSTPDGKFSVRLFVAQGDNLQQTDLQIRLNDATLLPASGPAKIMWNSSVSHNNGDFSGAGNEMNLFTIGMWYGNGDTYSSTRDYKYTYSVSNNPTQPAISGTNAASGVKGSSGKVGWGDIDVYAEGAPEQRKYIWTDTSSGNKVMYTVTAMLGAPSTVNKTGITNSNAATILPNSKAYLMIEQILAPD